MGAPAQVTTTELVLHRVDGTANGPLRCYADNLVGRSKADVNLTIFSELFQEALTPSHPSVPSFLYISFLVLFFVLARFRRK